MNDIKILTEDNVEFFICSDFKEVDKIVYQLFKKDIINIKSGLKILSKNPELVSVTYKYNGTIDCYLNNEIVRTEINHIKIYDKINIYLTTYIKSTDILIEIPLKNVV